MNTVFYRESAILCHLPCCVILYQLHSFVWMGLCMFVTQRLFFGIFLRLLRDRLGPQVVLVELAGQEVLEQPEQLAALVARVVRVGRVLLEVLVAREHKVKLEQLVLRVVQEGLEQQVERVLQVDQEVREQVDQAGALVVPAEPEVPEQREELEKLEVPVELEVLELQVLLERLVLLVELGRWVDQALKRFEKLKIKYKRTNKYYTFLLYKKTKT